MLWKDSSPLSPSARSRCPSIKNGASWPIQGLWFDPLKDALEAFIGSIQERVIGEVMLTFYKGSCTVVGRRSPWALYNEDLASFDSKTFDQSESVGNVKTHGMQSRMFWSLARQKGAK